MSILTLIETLATTALAALAIAAGTILVLGMLVGAVVWLSGSMARGSVPSGSARRS
jgi:hypothetical protein